MLEDRSCSRRRGKIEMVPAGKEIRRTAFGFGICPVHTDVVERAVQIGDMDRDAGEDPSKQFIGLCQFFVLFPNAFSLEVLVRFPEVLMGAPPFNNVSSSFCSCRLRFFSRIFLRFFVGAYCRGIGDSSSSVYLVMNFLSYVLEKNIERLSGCHHDSEFIF